MPATIERLAIDANGLTFTARLAGPSDGPGLILLHGFPETSWEWRDVMGPLAEAGYRVVAPDQRGYCPGARPSGVEPYAVHHLVDDVLAIADTMELTEFDLVGHDWGGMVAWMLAGRHPVRVRTLTVVSTPHPQAFAAALAGADPEQASRSSYITTFQQAGAPERLLLGEDGSGSGLRQLFVGTGGEQAWADEYLLTFSEPGAMTGPLNWYRAMDRLDTAGLAPIVMPTLYLWSTEDISIGRTAAELSAEYVAGRYRFVVLEGVSHWIPESVPETLCQHLLDHLASV